MCGIGNPPGTPASRKAAMSAAANPTGSNPLAAGPPPSIIDTGDAERRKRGLSRRRRGMAATFLTSPSGVLGSPLTVSPAARAG
jgi:hypothetical protein